MKNDNTAATDLRQEHVSRIRELLKDAVPKRRTSSKPAAEHARVGEKTVQVDIGNCPVELHGTPDDMFDDANAYCAEASALISVIAHGAEEAGANPRVLQTALYGVMHLLQIGRALYQAQDPRTNPRTVQ